AKYRNGRPKMWTPEYLSIPENTMHMLAADIEAERDAIRQYEAHISAINDEFVNAVLKRIIADEEYHIMLLQYLMGEL
ncbi:MAG: rubrerythrin family protein, partial [Lachnospiraceae bacterium]|nr:rubrerythrin family protein [Lachnospiraceae bacterium]